MSSGPEQQQQKRIFITGGSGYIGSQVTRLAIEAGYAVVGLSRSEAGDEKLQALGATAARGDLTSAEVIRRESERAGAGGPGSGVLHLADAWVGNWEMPYDRVVEIDGAAVDAMVSGLQKGSNGELRTLVTTSGSLVVESDPNGGETDEEAPANKDPANGRIKCERQALAYNGKAGIRVIALRLAPFVYGGGGSGIGMCLGAAAAAGEAPWVGDGATRVTGVHVDDAARAYVLALESDPKTAGGGAYNITHETHVTARELAGAFAKVLGVPAASRTFDEVVKSAGGGVLGRVLGRFMSMEHRASNAKACRELGWEPRGRGLVEEITEGSYVEVARALMESQSQKKEAAAAQVGI